MISASSWLVFQLRYPLTWCSIWLWCACLPSLRILRCVSFNNTVSLVDYHKQVSFRLSCGLGSLLLLLLRLLFDSEVLGPIFDWIVTQENDCSKFAQNPDFRFPFILQLISHSNSSMSIQIEI